MFSLRSLRSNRRIPSERKAAPSAPPRFRPQLEGFEDRTVPAAPVMGPALVAPVNISPTFNFNVLQLNVGDVQILSNNTLGVPISIGNVTQLVPITLSASPNPADPDCPILNLHLDPIHLDLLGLVVDTSEICLDITAHHGQGLLGDLLCGVSNLLNGGINLGNILGGLTTIDPNALTGALGNILDNVFGRIASANVLGVGGTSPGTTDILNLAVGPLDLNLLGLEVQLDNCHGGPVTVDITAESGPGKLLGNLLGGLSHLLDGPANGAAINRLVDRIESVIGSIVSANA